MTNQKTTSQLRELIALAATLEFSPVKKLEFFPQEKVLGVDKAFIFGQFAKSHGAYQTIEESLLALVCTTENLSAVNRRKQLVLSGELSPQEDLKVLNVLLSSHLPKHNKSPMLWQHRRWILQRYPQLLDLDTELMVLGHAGDRHQLNYYAFSYARWLASISSPTDIDKICDWCWNICYFHISDTSMWAFLAVVDSLARYRERATKLQLEYNRPAIGVYLQSLANTRPKN